MTVTYTKEVATCKGISCFLRLLFRWRGSIYKLVYLELIIFLFLYYTLNVIYRHLLNDSGKRFFEHLVQYCNASHNFIPLSFVLGFYVSIVMKRWWDQYTFIPFPDSIAVYVSATIFGNDERGRVMRRTIMRYVCLCVTMLFTNISPKVKKRFPSLDHFVEAGLLEQSEKQVIQGLNKKFPKFSKHWLPLIWASSIITRARKEGRIRDDFAVKTILDEINVFRGKCGRLINYDRISIPLVYTQVVTLAVYTYFLSALLGRQYVSNRDIDHSIDLYFPIFTLLQFFFYMGWLKVAESLINPFGDDDDDFELNWMVDRNLQISYLIVDEMHHEHPDLIKDHYWEQVLPENLPYTPETAKYRDSHPLPSTANLFSKYEDDLIGSSLLNDPGFKSSQRTVAASPTRGLKGRTNSVTSLLRRFMRSESLSSDPEPEVLGKFSKQKLEEVVEEVDEQLTIMSMRNESNPPSVRDVFGVPSQPIDIPDAREEVFETEPNSFESLRLRREEERLKKIKMNLTKYLENKDTD